MLPPHELKKKDFARALRGYNTLEVDEHIDFIIEKYTELFRRNDNLERELATVKAKLAELEANEEAIRRAMVNAQRTEHKIVTEANERADLIMRTAKHNCDRVLVDFKSKIRDERITLHKLRSSVAEFKDTMLHQYQTHLEFIEQIAPDLVTEPEWEMTEDEYTDQLLEQMKLDIAANTKPSFTEESVSQTEPSVSSEPSESGEKDTAAPAKKTPAKSKDTSDNDTIIDIQSRPRKARMASRTPESAATTISFEAVKAALNAPEQENDSPTAEVDFSALKGKKYDK